MLFRFSRCVVLLLLLTIFPLTSLHLQATIDFSKLQALSLEEFTDNLSYDQLLKLLELIESGEIERYSQLEQAKIAHFVAYLAEKGILANEDHSDLEEDIDELLAGQENFYAKALFHKSDGKLRCTSSKSAKELIPTYQFNWFSKKFRHLKRFVHKHKREIIIGVAVVVATAVVVTVVVVSAKAAAAGAAAAAIAADEKVAQAKEQAAEAGLFEETVEEPLPLVESARALGSLFAHEAIAQSEGIPEAAHADVDQSFGVKYAHLLHFENIDFPMISYQMRGEHALYCGYFEQAVEDFGKVIAYNPDYSLAYLDRSFAHFELGNYQSSLDDYHQYSKHIEKFSVPEFTLGFAKGLPKGIYDSFDGTLLFISDIVSHPIDTSTQIWHSLNQLKNMVSAGEWALLGEVLVPEVYQLVTEWDSLPSVTRGELAGYALGKHGTDILLPGAATKVAISGIRCTKEIYAVLKNLQQAEQLLVLESVAAIGSGTVIGETVTQAKSIITLGEEVGLTTQELGHLKQAGTLENVVTQKAKFVFEDPALKASFEFYKQAEIFLDNYNKIAMPETRVRELIHQTGIKTFPKPQGVPDNYLVKITKKGGGMEYFHPYEDSSIRIMPGKPHSPWPYQQKPYVIITKNGDVYDKIGNMVNKNDPLAHIPIDEFRYAQ